MPADIPVPRVMRVFISSTFRDMHGDRDELVKRVFPRLRALCEERHVAWSEVDLRWGISSEQHAEGKVLPICLTEIEQCRPYFIGLLGERYGWIPERIAPELIAREPWLAGQAGRSVTELEIVKGVLGDPAMAEHAFFYFRDPRYAGGAADEGADAEERHAKLALLKDRIRASGLPVRESYADPRALGELVYQDLAGVIERRFPAVGAPDRFQRENEEQEYFAASRRELYVANERLYAALDDFADGAGPPLLVIGSPGVGKSALLANWIPRQRARRPDVFVLPHFVGATVDSSDFTSTLWRLVRELRAHYDIPLEKPRNPGALRAMFLETLRMVGARGRTVILLDDPQALTDRGSEPDMEWLPRDLPDGVRLIATAGPGPGLDALAPGKWRLLTVDRLTEADARELITRYLGYFAKSLSREEVDRIVAVYPSGNPLYLRLLLDELRVYGDHDTLSERVTHYLIASSTATLYQLILARYEADYDVTRPGLVGAAMRSLWASRNGLAEAELLDLLGDGDVGSRTPLPYGTWAPLRFAMGPSLLNRGGRVVFSHRALRTAVEARYLGDDGSRRHAHSTIAAYFNRFGVTDRTAEELAWQICEAEQWEFLAKLLAIPEYLEAAWDHRADDVRGFWAKIESKSAIRMPVALAPLLSTEHPDTEVSRIAVELLSGFGYLEEAHALARRMVAALVRDEARPLLARALSLQASIERERGDFGAALATYEQMESLAAAMGERQTATLAMLGRATTLLDRGDLDASEALFQEVERLALELGDPHTAGIAIGNRAIIRQAKGDDDGALVLHDREEPLLRAARDELSVARALGNRAIILQRAKRFDEAGEAYARAEEIFLKLGDKSALVATVGNRAALAIDRGDDDAALPLCRAQQALARDAGFLPMLRTALTVERAILARRGDEDGEQRVLAELRNVLSELKNQRAALAALQARGNILFKQGDFATAIAVCREHATLARELGDLEALQGGLGNESVALRKLGRFDQALVRAKEQTAVCRELNDAELVVRSLLARAPLLVNEMRRIDDAIAVFSEAHDEAMRAGLEHEAAYAADLLARLDPHAP